MFHVDYIIVGGGLAGCTLAYKLSLLNKKIILFSQEEQGQASKVASGIANPMVLKTLNKVWKADELMSISAKYYQKTEAELAEKFIRKIDIMRLFSSHYAFNEWIAKTSYLHIKNVVKTELDKDIINDYGYGILTDCYWLDTKKYIYVLEKKFNNYGILRNEKPDYMHIKINADGIQYKEIHAAKIIFCEGAFAVNNPYFPQKALKPVKGEELTIRYAGNLNYAIKKNLMLLPLNSQQAKIGSNYEWNYTNPLPNNNTATTFTNELKKMLRINTVEIINHEAGIRPASNDRKPLVGQHPEFKNIYFLNGLGTRGVMLAPYLSESLINFCEKNIPLDKEADIKRMY